MKIDRLIYISCIITGIFWLLSLHLAISDRSTCNMIHPSSKWRIFCSSMSVWCCVLVTRHLYMAYKLELRSVNYLCCKNQKTKINSHHLCHSNFFTFFDFCNKTKNDQSILYVSPKWVHFFKNSQNQGIIRLKGKFSYLFIN